MPSRKSPLNALPKDFFLTLADIGSAGGLRDRWKPVAPRVRALLFEPREEGTAPTSSGRNRIFPVALAEASGTRNLRITAMPNMSSLLEPNSAMLGRFRKKGAHAQVVRRVEVPVEPLDALLRREGMTVDALKIDTQGSELLILQGAVQALEDSVMLAEVEISFIERYAGQALAAQLLSWMQGRGFQLVEIYRLKRYRAQNRLRVGNVGTGGGHRAGQLAYGDAVFVADEALLERRWARLAPDVVRHQLVALLVALGVYGKVDLAAATLEHHEQRLDDVSRVALRAWLSAWSRAEYGPRGLHVVMDFLSRKT